MAGLELTCRACGVQFVHDRRKAYCSAKCYPSRQRESEPWAWAESRQTFRCFCCGAWYQPKRKGRITYCSRECCFTVKAAFEQNKRQDAALMHAARSADRLWRASPQGVEETKERARQYWKARYKPITETNCVQCGGLFTRGMGNPTRFLCSAVCFDEQKQKERRIKTAQKQVRRRRQQSGERIDPIAVFKRDGWKCQICGCRTPQSRRGSHHPKAPELDHIVALANGGAHAWDNVQCACRSCNGSKGASDYGQMLLFPKDIPGGVKSWLA